MWQVADETSAPDLRLLVTIMRGLMGALIVIAILVGIYVVRLFEAPAAYAAEGTQASPQPTIVAAPDTTTSSTAATTTTTSTTTTTTTTPPTSTTIAAAPVGPPQVDRYVVPSTEVAPGAKQLAVDIAQLLTTYEEDDDPRGRLGLVTSAGIDLLTEASAALTYDGSWSRGEIVYPQLGGLTDDRASVMVVTRQIVGSGTDTAFTVVRAIDIRLVMGDDGWEFDSLASAGGAFEDVASLVLSHDVAADPRITMSDSARLDIRAGLVSTGLLEVMADLADLTPYEATVLATGHPINVFETDRMSHHTMGRAVDINRVGDRLVVDDRSTSSMTRTVVEWLMDHPTVIQVGSPWDLDGELGRRSFTDTVHQDHIHVAVVEG